MKLVLRVRNYGLFCVWFKYLNKFELAVVDLYLSKLEYTIINSVTELNYCEEVKCPYKNTDLCVSRHEIYVKLMI